MDMDKLVSLCKRRGFLFQSSEIYGGLNGFWDYGPLGVELKRNVKEAWWRDMVTGHDDLAVLPGAPEAFEMTGLDCTIIMHPQVWKCSGHYDLFHDYMVDCRESKKRYRHDQVRGRWVEAKGQTIFVATQVGGEEGLAETQQRALKFFNLRGKDADELQWEGELVSLTTVKDFSKVLGPDAKELGTLTEPREFNLMFKTYVGRSQRRGGSGLPAARNGPGHFCQLQERARQHARPRAVRHRADGQELSQRDHAAQLHLSLARVRADGDRVLLPSQRRRPSGTSIWRDRRYQWYLEPGAGRRAAAAARSRRRRAEPLLVRHGRHRIRVSVPAAGRIRRAGGHRPSRRFRSAQPHGRQARAPGRCAGRRDWTPKASRSTAAAART